MSGKQPMRFEAHGRSYHLTIHDADGLRQVLELDEALWVATNAPLATIHGDATFLIFVDADNTGRITCRDLQQAIRWTFDVLRDAEGVTERRDSVRLDQLNEEHPDGRRIADACRKILRRLDAPESQPVTIAHVRQIKAREEARPVSEAGVVLPEAATDEEVRGFLSAVRDATGGADHPSGARGVSAANLTAFQAQSAAWIAWHEQGRLGEDGQATAVQPLGERTASAWAALSAVEAKIDQYFAQCEALALDESFLARMGWTESELQEIDFDDPQAIQKVMAAAPIARARPTRELVLTEKVNPFYAEALEDLRRQVLEPVLGQSPPVLTARQWLEVKAVFEPYRQWLAARPEPAVAAVGLDRLQAYQDPRFAAAVQGLIGESNERAFVLDNIRTTEKLLLYQMHLIELANNMVSFPHLYDPRSRAMCEMGTLIIDGRRLNMAVKVDSRPQHAAVAQTSSMFVVYVEVCGPGAGPKYEIACPVTWGDKGNLVVGKRGIFRDVWGNECDAHIVQIIENPVSVWEALTMPFRRIGKLITGKIESIASNAEKKFDVQATTAINQVPVGQPGQPPAAPAPATAIPGGRAGMVVGASLAVAALGSAVAYITKTLAETHWAAILAGIAVALLAVLMPIALVAMLKLRRRDLSAILEGSGWGINARMRLTRRQKKYFTRRPPYPRHARGVHSILVRRILILLAVLSIVAAAVVAAERFGLFSRDRQDAAPAAAPEAPAGEPAPAAGP